MARGVEKSALGAAGTDTSYASGYNSQQNDLYQTLFPSLNKEINKPTGYGGDLATMEGTIGKGTGEQLGDISQGAAAANTASQQSLGGSTAGVVGQGGLQAARTRNAGAFTPAMDEAARSAGRQLSENALGVQEDKAKADQGIHSQDELARLGVEQANAELKAKQQQAGYSGLEDLYGQNIGATLKALGLVPENLGVATDASKATTAALRAPFQDIADLANAGANVYKAAKS